MGDGNDGAAAQAQVAGEPQTQVDQTAQAAVTAGLQGANVADNGGDAVARAHKDYEAALAERDARIAELEGEIAEAAKTAEGAEALRREMDELRRRGDEERVGFELQIAGARNVKAAEPWLFGAGGAAPAQAGATGLPNAGAATDEGAQMRRWRKIAGIDDEEE